MKALGVLAMVLLDSAFTGGGSRRASGPRDATAPSVRRERPLRVYPSREEASRRFRLRPPQPCDNGYILRHLAYHSVREVEGGWGWKSDHQVFARMVNPKGLELPALPAMMQQCDFPVGVIFGEKSRFFPLAAVAELNRMLAPEQVICLKDAHHHLFLDRPQQFIDALRRLLSGWQLP
jgi:pimeloyl-ACP methyl ester carboxylesterase